MADVMCIDNPDFEKNLSGGGWVGGGGGMRAVGGGEGWGGGGGGGSARDSVCMHACFCV